MKIEKVTEKDTEALLDIYAFYVENTAVSFEYETPSVEEFAGRIRRISARYPYIKAEDNGMIIGYAYADVFKARAAYDWAVETTVYVKPEHRYAGVGSRLYESLEWSLADMGISNMNACIAYTAKADEYLNNASMYFHEKMGFDMVGTFHECGYKFSRWYDMIWMEKIIGAHNSVQADVRFGDWKLA
jgi:phosphinothricin acetyltransferase